MHSSSSHSKAAQTDTLRDLQIIAGAESRDREKGEIEKQRERGEH